MPLPLNPNLSYRVAICFGSSTDTITANPTGGTPGYTYHWSNTDTTASVMVPAGKLDVSVYDSQNCVVTDSVNILHETTNVNTKNVLTLSLCVAPGYGNLTSQASGGIPPYTYTVVGVGTDTTGKFPNLLPGTYTLFVADSVGCFYQGSQTIPKSVANDSFSIMVDSATCYGLNNGTIVVTPLNPGDSPFSYQLNGGTGQGQILQQCACRVSAL